MSKPKGKLPLYAVFTLFLITALFPAASAARLQSTDEHCASVFCGNINISYPFRLKTQPLNCGNPKLELECDNNNRTNLVIKDDKFTVKDIYYQNYTIRVVDANLDSRPDDCDSNIPRSTVSLACEVPYIPYIEDNKPLSFSYMYLVNCSRPIESPLYVDASRCANHSSSSTITGGRRSFYYYLDESTLPSDFNQNCRVEASVQIAVRNISGMSTADVYRKLSKGILLSWEYYEISTCRSSHKISFQDILSLVRYGFGVYLDSFVNLFRHGFDITSDLSQKRTYFLCLEGTGGFILLRPLFGIPCLLALVIYKWRRRHLSMDHSIEEFLQSQNNFSPIRYSFREIKKITKGFKDKLGEGGYGSVFKGKLRSGQHVAVKLLGKSKGNGQDFINEVASIGRIHHVNVAKLTGFCVEGSKQALVYEFMVNGSLDKIIFSEENKNNLSWKKMFDIVLGVARGIDYLHQGCDMQILHFDIKPHNILLDENFNPKVSDFGLAKLYSVEDSIVSLTAARGTIGYIAPELVYKNIGGISYKADVYSFGMLLMEMVGRRKNFNAFTDKSSRMYFPSWIYDRLDQGEDIVLGVDINDDDERKLVRKMVMVAFWCIQMKPADRPSMSKVLKMLESDVEVLEMPPRPFHHDLLEPSSSESHVTGTLTEDPTTSLMQSVPLTSLNVV